MGLHHPSIRQLIQALTVRRDVEVLTLFGSQARSAEDSSADVNSDVDLQVVVRNPAEIVDSAWARELLGAGGIEAWNVRNAFGGVRKISIVLQDVEVDLVVIPARRMRWARWALRWGVHRRIPKIGRQMGDLTLVMGRGYRVLKGGQKWEDFWSKLVAEVPEPRLSNAEIENLVEGVKVDYVSIKRKIERGELLAAQRWLHVGIAETNFTLLHELRTRQGRLSFHDGRRAEFVWDQSEMDRLRISAKCDAAELLAATETAVRAAKQTAQEILELS